MQIQEATIHRVSFETVGEKSCFNMTTVLIADVSVKHTRFKPTSQTGARWRHTSLRHAWRHSSFSPALVCKCLSAPLTWTRGEPPPSRFTLTVGLLHRSTLPSSDQLKVQPTNSSPAFSCTHIFYSNFPFHYILEENMLLHHHFIYFYSSYFRIIKYYYGTNQGKIG